MVLKYLDNKITFIIDTLCSIGFENKGASFVIHKLAYELANLGNIVYIFNPPLYPHENIHVIKTERFIEDGGWRANFVWESFEFNTERTVSIYTQVTTGNPFNTKHNTRWILHHYQEDTWLTYDEKDYICNFGSFNVPQGTNQTKLTTFNYNLDKFFNTNNPNRKGFGHILHKNTPDWGLEFLNNFRSTKIPHHNGMVNIDYLLEEFNKYEYVLTFDDKSYYTTAAALCGAKVIILNPNEDITPIEYRIQNPIQMCGVAYGFNDIKWAEKTIDLVKDNLLELKKRDKKTIDKFIKYWENKLL